MKQVHHPKVVQQFFKGANRDLEKELLGSGAEGVQGEYVDAHNMRPTSRTGKEGASEKIKGEKLHYASADNRCTVSTPYPVLDGTWKCIGNIEVNEYKVEVWVDISVLASNPLIRIDGQIVAQSSGLPFDIDHPLQITKNENCKGGEIFIFDNQNPPIYFNVEDMLLNSGKLGGSCTGKYFANFNIKKYTSNLEVAPDIPVFIELVNLSGGGGLPAGQYAYKIRSATEAGDRTKFTPWTPLIPVVSNLVSITSPESNQYPYVRTFGKDPEPLIATNYGIKIKFRITNLLGYDNIEVARVAYNAGAAIGFLPNVEKIYRIEIANEEIDVITLIDGATTTATDSGGASRGVVEIETITDVEDTSVMSAIKRAKTGKYFDQRLAIGNVEYASRDIENTCTFRETANNKKLFPLIEKLGVQGYNDPYNHAYKRQYMGGEKYGFALIGYDSGLEKSLAKAIDGFDTANDNYYNNYLIPNRRLPASTDTKAYSPDIVTAAPLDGGVAKEVHEVFDLVNGVAKTDKCTFKNILNAGDKSNSKVNSEGCPDSGLANWLGRVRGADIGLKPYTPVGHTDTDVNGLNYMVNPKVWDSGSELSYSPDGFGPEYYAKGLAVAGVENLPDWMQSFSMVRTEPAGRVVAQGLAYWALRGGSLKYKDRIFVYAPDLDVNIGINPSIIDDIIANPGTYGIQFVSPLGFFSEVYTGDKQNAPSADFRGVDMISYARILRETGSINTGDTTGNVGKNGYVSYGKWRNPAEPAGGLFPNGNSWNGTTKDLKEVGIVSITAKKSVTGRSGNDGDGRGTYYEIKLDTNVFYYGGSGGQTDFDELKVQENHEPVYVINIVQTGKNVEDANVNNYVETGHYQKISSIIGKSNGQEIQSYELVDERWEDCIPALDAGHPTAPNDRFVYVEDTTGVEHAWMDVTFKTAGQITTILDDIVANGYHVASDTDGTLVYGVYKHTNIRDRFFTINLSHFDTSYDKSFFVPDQGDTLRVRYNKYVPIRFFGGDTFIGEAIFSPIDNKYDENSRPTNDDNIFTINMGMPYRKWLVNPRHYIINIATSLTNKIQDDNEIDFFPGGRTAYFRQLCVMFTCETKTHLAYAHNANSGNNQFYPLINYIMRPHDWAPDKPLDGSGIGENNIFADYEVEYPGEASVQGQDGRWYWGGFRFLPLTNTDYSQENTTTGHLSKPQIGFEEKNEFCTRVAWSLQRAINIQDSPGLRTFPITNAIDIDDDQGPIKYAFLANSGKGENLYAITASGVCLLLTKQLILSQANADELALIGSDDSGLILGSRWISRKIGMPDELWRGAAEWDNALFFPNKKSVYILNDNKITPIGDIKYHSRLYNDSLGNMAPGFEDEITGVYDTLFKEYWLSINTAALSLDVTAEVDIFLDSIIGYEDNKLIRINPLTEAIDLWIENNIHGSEIIKITNGGDYNIEIRLVGSSTLATLVSGASIVLTRTGATWVTSALTNDDKEKNLYIFSTLTNYWLGTYGHEFDRFISFENRTFGVKGLETYELNKGPNINSLPVEGWILSAIAPEQPNRKEFVRIVVNTNDIKPTNIEFFDEIDGTVQTRMNEAKFGPHYLKHYDGFENFIPRREITPHNRMQGRVMFYKIFHNLAEEFSIVNAEIQYKNLK